MDKKLVKLTESDLHKIVKETVNRVLKEDINNITPLSTHAQNDRDADMEILGNVVSELRGIYNHGSLKKWSPFVAAKLKSGGAVDEETINTISKISQLIYALGNMDFSHKRTYGETWDELHNRLYHEQD